MYELLKKYRARLLAIATAFLMVAFLAPTFGRGTGNDQPVGRAYGKRFYLSQVRHAQQDYQLLRTKVLTQLPGPTGQPQLAPVVFELGEYAVSQLEKHSDMYFLLVTEAHKQGVYISDDMLKDKHQQLFLPDLDMRRADVAAQVNEALRDFMAVEECYRRMLSAIRVSEPLTSYELATRMQQIQISAVDFKASDYAKSIAAPTPAQLQQQFDKYKDLLPTPGGVPPKDNPYGFGYRFPDRVQVQYLMVGTEAVRKAVEASKPAERWRVDARKYYYNNPKGFTATTKPAGTTQPVAVTRPFEEVTQDALDAVILPEVEKLQTAILARINSIVNTDWNAYHDAKGQATKSSLGVAFDSYEYLQKLVEDIQKQYNVQIAIGASGKLLSVNDMDQLGPIATAATGARVPFPIYATLTEEMRKRMLDRIPGLPQPLALMQPSQSLRDLSGDMFVFRRTAFDAAHTSKDIAEVATKVEADVRAVLAMEKAQQVADEFLKTAKANGFLTTAVAQKRPVANSGPISLSRGIAMGLNLSDTGTRQFMSSAFEQLLSLRAQGEKMPLAEIAVPLDGKVIVARLDDVKAMWNSNEYSQLVSYVDQSVASQMGMPMQQEWFTFSNLSKRVEFKPENPSTQPADEGPSAPEPSGPLGL